MLVLTRKPNESIMIGDQIELSILSVSGEKVRIGVEAPREIPVFRKEIWLAIREQGGESDPSAQADVNEALKRLADG
jgi:carbon storage regulator